MGKLSPILKKVNKALDMREAARMKRAEEMGFDTSQTYYHRTHDDIKEFDKSKADGFWFNDQAEIDIDEVGASGGDRVTMPVYLKYENELVSGPNQNVEDIASDGYDAIVNNYDGFTDVAVLEPNQIRSVNAVFDPAKKNSGDILAGLSGAGILGASMLTPEQAAAADSFAAQDNDGIYADEFPTLDRIGTLMNKLNLPIVGRPLEGTANYLQRLGEPRSKWDRAKDSAGAALDLL